MAVGCRSCHRHRVEPYLPSNRTPGSSKAWKRTSRAHKPCMHSPQCIDATLEEASRNLRAGSAHSVRRQIVQILYWYHTPWILKGTHKVPEKRGGTKRNKETRNGAEKWSSIIILWRFVRGSTSRSIETGEVFQQQAGLSIHPAACLLAVLGDAVKICTGEPSSPHARRPFAWRVDPGLQCVAPLLFSGTCRIMFCKKLKFFFFPL